MEAQDVRPSRLAAAQAAALAFVRHAPKRLRIGIVVFAGEPQVALVPTRDHDLVARSITVMGTSAGLGGTAIGDALVSAVRVGLNAIGARSGSGLVSILFLSDGRQNRGIVPPLDGAARARAARIPVYTVALGTANGSLPGGFGGGGGGFGGGGGSFGGGGFLAPDPATLRAIARATGGEFTRARSAETLRAAYARLGSRLGRKRATREVTNDFAAAGAALLAAAGVLAALWSPRLP
jgi:Ca-activated chloride channel family protein